jgi:hypothetical protein
LPTNHSANVTYFGPWTQGHHEEIQLNAITHAQ